MPSRPDSRRAWLPAALLGCALSAMAATPPSASPRVDVGAVEAAASAVRADPRLGGVEKARTWRFKSRDDDAAPELPSPWLIELARWLAEGGRGLVWVIGAALFALLLVSARRWMQARGEGLGAHALALPSHVRDLDIRPESLPMDIGAAARGLWLGGAHREALSLLYRGALSRLVHGHALAIGSASTEGECVALAGKTLPRETSGFFAQLVAAWQFAVYGARLPETAVVLGLCRDFEARLGAAGPAMQTMPASA